MGRTSKGLTQRGLAELVKSATGTIQQYELDKRQPRQKQLSGVAEVLQLPISFFQATPPFEDLEFLNSFKAVILNSLEKHGYFHSDGRVITEIDDYEYWKCVADHIVSIVKTGENTLSIQYRASRAADAEQVRYTTAFLSLNFSEVLEPLIDNGHAVTTYRILNSLNRLNDAGQQKAVERVEELTEIPKYQRKAPPPDSPLAPPGDE